MIGSPGGPGGCGKLLLFLRAYARKKRNRTKPSRPALEIEIAMVPERGGTVTEDSPTRESGYLSFFTAPHTAL